jgi:hypothetical protein
VDDEECFLIVWRERERERGSEKNVKNSKK